MTLLEHIEQIPKGWMLMSLSGPSHTDGRYYCCLLTTDPAGVGRVSAWSENPDEAFHAAMRQIAA